MVESKSKVKSFVISKKVVLEAWEDVKSNQGAAGVDGETIEDFERNLSGNLYQIWNRLSSGSYMPPAVRAVQIPKKHSLGVRTLGIPTIADRVAQTVVKRYLEPNVEPVFHDDSYGYRPGRSAHDALRVCRDRCWKYFWVIDWDLQSFLVASSYCLGVHGGGVEEGVFGLWDEYSWAFSASVAYVDGLQVAALDTLQHCLAGDAEDSHRVDDRDVAGGCVLDEQCAELVVDADSPGGAWGVLLAADESGLEAAVQGGRCDAESVGGLADGEQLPVGWLGGRLVGGDVAVAAQSADDDCGESLTGRGAAVLAVKDPGDLGVGGSGRRDAPAA